MKLARVFSFFFESTSSLEVEVRQVAPPGHPPEVGEVARPHGEHEALRRLVPRGATWRTSTSSEEVLPGKKEKTLAISSIAKKEMKITHHGNIFFCAGMEVREK